MSETTPPQPHHELKRLDRLVYWWIDASQEPDTSSWPVPTEWRTELVQPIASMAGSAPVIEGVSKVDRAEWRSTPHASAS